MALRGKQKQKGQVIMVQEFESKDELKAYLDEIVPFYYNDGGRSEYFKAKGVGDCVLRALCIATGKNYKEGYNELKKYCKNPYPIRRQTEKHCKELDSWKKDAKTLVRDGLSDKVGLHFLQLWSGGKFVKTGKTTVCDPKLQKGVHVLYLRKHWVTVVDGVWLDSWDSRVKTPCVVPGIGILNWREPVIKRVMTWVGGEV
jgi:hypothetical protein